MANTPDDEQKRLEAEWKRASSIGNSKARWQSIRTWGGILFMGALVLLYIVARATKGR